MDRLLIVPLTESLVEALLPSFRQAGWQVTIVTDVDQAKALLQKGGVTGIGLELDPRNPDPNRLSLLKHVHEFHPGTLAILMNSITQPFQTSTDNLLHAMQSMNAASEEDRPPTITSCNLTPAQQRIADLVARAYPNRAIARQLNIKEQSVRNELSRIFKKTGTWNRVELALLMRRAEKKVQEEQMALRPKEETACAAASAAEFKPSMDPQDLGTRPPLQRTALGDSAGRA
jgi:DNA-binding NarL/FixJ family response regulator